MGSLEKHVLERQPHPGRRRDWLFRKAFAFEPRYPRFVIKSANQYPVHTLLSYEGNLMYRVPPYQREYSWQKAQWEALLEDLIEADGAHFLGTIITLNQTTDAVESGLLEVIDGQQRLTTITLLMAAIHSVLTEHKDTLDDDTKTDLTVLGRQLVRKGDGKPRLTPQTQGNNRDDYAKVLSQAGLNVDAKWIAYFPTRRISKCYNYFRDAIADIADAEAVGREAVALRLLKAVQQAILVKIEVANHADAFVLFESLNNRGMPLTPVDLIKNYLLAEAERKKIMGVDVAFKHWNVMLTNLGDNYATQERFLRHYYNAFRADLPRVTNAPVATRANLIRIYETLLTGDLQERVDELVSASSVYGRISCVVEVEAPTSVDRALRQLLRVQGTPAYVLIMWLMQKQQEIRLSDSQLVEVIKRLVSFFVRRNLTGNPQTYALPRLFMTLIEDAAGKTGEEIADLAQRRLAAVSAPDQEFRRMLEGPIYNENTDMARFILTTLAEDVMTKETWKDLWSYDKGHYTWTIEHILPQGANLPEGWISMLGGTEAAQNCQEQHVHRLGNLTITAFNSTLSNKAFLEKRDREDSKGRPIGYRNGLGLNAELAHADSWTARKIEARTKNLVDKVVARFPL